jgi:hypothetical protein
MREFFATILALVIIVGTVWGVFTLLALGVLKVSSLGVHPGLLYFLAGVCFAATYKKTGRWFANYCDTVWEKISSFMVWK